MKPQSIVPGLRTRTWNRSFLLISKNKIFWTQTWFQFPIARSRQFGPTRVRESLNIESLLLRLERSQLRWYGHVTRMSQERTAKKLLCSTLIGRRPRGRPRTRWRDYVEDLSWSRLGIPAKHLSFVAEDRDAWRLQLALLPPRPPKDKRVQKIDWLIELKLEFEKKQESLSLQIECFSFRQCLFFCLRHNSF